MDLREYVKDVPGFPQPGIMFRDVTPMLQSSDAFGEVTKCLAKPFWPERTDNLCVVGIEARGFIFAAALAREYHAGFVPVRKAGKLPRRRIKESYSLEYREGDILEIHEDAIKPGQPVLVVDDVLATGGTAVATCKLLKRLGAHILGCTFVIELEGLGGRMLIRKEINIPTHSVIKY